MKSSILKKTALVIIVFSSINIFATDFYCDIKKGNVNNIGSKDKPWGKLEDVFASGKTFQGGDKIHLSKGNHGNIIIVGVNAKYVKIIGGNQTFINSIKFGNKDTKTAKWSLENVEIVNDNIGIYISDNSRKIKINSVYIINKTKSNKTTSIGIEVRGDKCKIESCNISGKLVSIKNSGSMNLFANNVITNFYKNGILSSGDNNTFENNLIKESYQKTHDNIAILIDNINRDTTVVKSNIIRANQIINFQKYNRDFIGQLKGIVSKVRLDNCILENNLIITNSKTGIYTPSINNSKVVNNTLANPYFGIVLIDKKNIENSIMIGHENSPKSTNVIVRNNIANNYVFENLTGIEDHNIKLEVNVKKYDKNFFNWAKFDFSLAESSMALNSGIVEAAPEKDANLVSRSLGNFINIGAFEYGKIDESNQKITIFGDEHDRELRSNGKDDWDGQPQIRIGGSGADFDGVGVFPFQLPLLPGGKKIVSADFSAYMIKIDNVPNGDIDVYGLAYKNNYWVTHDMFYQGVYGQDLKARPIQSRIADGNSISGTTTLDEKGKLGLKAYINTAYSAGAKTGDFIFIRLNPSEDDVTPYHRWIFRSANTENNKEKAKLYLTIGYPELNKPDAKFNKMENMLVVSPNVIDDGKVNLRFYGIENENLKIKFYTYRGSVVFEKQISKDEISNGFIESINDEKLQTGKYIMEVVGDSFSKKQSMLVW